MSAVVAPAVGARRPPWGSAPKGYWTRDRVLEALLWWHERHGAWPTSRQWQRGGHPDYDTYLLPPATTVTVALGWENAKALAEASREGRLFHNSNGNGTGAG